jgi:uroporphyrinogen-III synthase
MPGLEGRTMILTRSTEDSGEWASELEARGAFPIVFPCITTETYDDPELAGRITAALATADWLIFTSRRGVDALADLVGTDLPATLRLAGVGEATAARIGERFGRSALAGPGTAQGLASELGQHESIRAGASCVLALAENAGDTLENTLCEAGAAVSRFSVYRTRPAEPVEPRQPLSTLGSDTVIFASPSAVTGFDNQVAVDIAGLFVTIGPSTSAAVKARHWDVAAEAKEQSLAGIIESLLETEHV